MASQITSLTIVYSTAYSDADERKHQSPVSLAFVLVTRRANNAKNISVWWRHHDYISSVLITPTPGPHLYHWRTRIIDQHRTITKHSKVRTMYLLLNTYYMYITWCRHQMGTFLTLLAICAGNSPITAKFPSQMPVTLGFDFFFWSAPE